MIKGYRQEILPDAAKNIYASFILQANAYLSTNEKIKLTPHMLRHSFLKRVADKHGLHVAQNLSGNVSIKEIFRYTKPDNNQKHDMVQELF